MKAVSLHQPWAILLAAGVKRIETRSWPTRHRGQLAIHATKQQPWPGYALSMAERLDLPLERGAVVGVVDVADCVPADELELSACDYVERNLGDYSPGRYAWTCLRPGRLTSPVPCRGRQGIWTVPPEVAERVVRRLR